MSPLTGHAPWHGAGALICRASAARQVPVLMTSVLPVVQVLGTGAATGLTIGKVMGAFMLPSPEVAGRPSGSLRRRPPRFRRAAGVSRRSAFATTPPAWV